ncbi:MAG: ATP-grasp domain-containing protein, partial [Cyclobacteriaceae bacterium]|nr:ATP-grasp domain-containing protein [Cyclobacteriaceae bacterium]
MRTILITGARAPISFEFLRSFHKSGFKVILADSLKFPFTRWSNKIHKYYLLPPPKSKTIEFINAIRKIIKTEQVDHLIPTCEEVFYISMYKSELDCKVWTEEIELLNALHNKYLFSRTAKPFLTVPETIRLSDFSDWANSDQYVFKPTYSRFATSTILGKKIKSTHFKEDETDRWIAQKFIEGKEICIYSIWDEGNLKAIIGYYPLYRSGQGAGIYFKPLQNPQIFNLVKTFGEHLNYTGQLAFDVIVDKNEKPYFIECNPRGTSGAHLLENQLANCFISNAMPSIGKTEYSIKSLLGIYHPFALFK